MEFLLKRLSKKMKDSIICREIYKKIGDVDSILDVGCGKGYLVNCLAQKFNKKVIGFDISNSGFLKSHEKCKKFGTCSLIECRQGDAHNINRYFQHKFDTIIISYTLHHIKKPVIALINIRKILKNKGKIIIGDFWFTKRKKKRGCYRFTVDDIKKLLKKAGFKYFGQDRISKDFVLITGEK